MRLQVFPLVMDKRVIKYFFCPKQDIPYAKFFFTDTPYMLVSDIVFPLFINSIDVGNRVRGLYYTLNLCGCDVKDLFNREITFELNDDLTVKSCNATEIEGVSFQKTAYKIIPEILTNARFSLYELRKFVKLIYKNYVSKLPHKYFIFLMVCLEESNKRKIFARYFNEIYEFEPSDEVFENPIYEKLKRERSYKFRDGYILCIRREVIEMLLLQRKFDVRDIYRVIGENVECNRHYLQFDTFGYYIDF